MHVKVDRVRIYTIYTRSWLILSNLGPLDCFEDPKANFYVKYITKGAFLDYKGNNEKMATCAIWICSSSRIRVEARNTNHLKRFCAGFGEV
jgi:hypothetical protein